MSRVCSLSMRRRSPFFRIVTAGAVVAAACGLGVAALAPATSTATPRDPRLQMVKGWAFAIGTGALAGDVGSRYAPFDLVVVDGEEATASQVAAMRARGTIVLGYLSVGTIEPFRSWYKRLKRFRLPDKFEEFDEFFARVKSKGYRRAITRIAMNRVLSKGFDGLFLDNTDMVEDHPKQRRGMRKLVQLLAGLVRGRGGFLFSQNGERVIGPLLPFYDGWNREDVTWTFSFKRHRYVHRPAFEVEAALAALRQIGAAGLLTLATDYTAGDAAATNEAVNNACSAGALPFVSNIGLSRIPSQPFTCP